MKNTTSTRIYWAAGEVRAIANHIFNNVDEKMKNSIVVSINMKEKTGKFSRVEGIRDAVDAAQLAVLPGSRFKNSLINSDINKIKIVIARMLKKKNKTESQMTLPLLTHAPKNKQAFKHANSLNVMGEIKARLMVAESIRSLNIPHDKQEIAITAILG